MVRRLKVYRSHIGFFDTVVAAPNQRAALEAWGVGQNLFASGAASVTDDADAGAALEHPLTPLRRFWGDKGPFSRDPGPPPDQPRGRPSRKAADGSPPHPPDRSRLDAAEAALSALEARRSDDEADFEREARELRARRAEAHETYRAERRRAEHALERARRDWRAAGGRD